MKLYVINLDRSKERLKHVEQLFSNLNLVYHRIAAVDGNQLTSEMLAKYVRKSGKDRTLSAAEIGCYLSHLNCFK